jgi:hypothetical protein
MTRLASLEADIPQRPGDVGLVVVAMLGPQSLIEAIRA